MLLAGITATELSLTNADCGESHPTLDLKSIIRLFKNIFTSMSIIGNLGFESLITIFAFLLI